MASTRRSTATGRLALKHSIASRIRSRGHDMSIAPAGPFTSSAPSTLNTLLDAIVGAARQAKGRLRGDGPDPGR